MWDQSLSPLRRLCISVMDEACDRVCIKDYGNRSKQRKKIAAAICKHEASLAKTFIGRQMHPSHGKTKTYYSRTCLIQRKVFYNNCNASAPNKLSRLYESSLTMSLLISSSQANIVYEIKVDEAQLR